MGGRPGWVQRRAIDGQKVWELMISQVGSLLTGKDYELSRMMLHHYLVEDGAPLVYTPPQAVQDEITRRVPKPGHYENLKPYDWGNPDIRNGIGHFNLDVVDSGNGKKQYYITDRYQFPHKNDKGQIVRHGFQVGKLSDERARQINERLAKLGEFTRMDGRTKERYEVVKTEPNGEYTFYVPQRDLIDNGVDFESLGMFEVDSRSAAAKRASTNK